MGPESSSCHQNCAKRALSALRSAKRKLHSDSSFNVVRPDREGAPCSQRRSAIFAHRSRRLSLPNCACGPRPCHESRCSLADSGEPRVGARCAGPERHCSGCYCQYCQELPGPSGLGQGTSGISALVSCTAKVQNQSI